MSSSKILNTANKGIVDAHGSPVLDYTSTKKLLKTVDSVANVSAELVVPITLKEIRDWVEKWQATELKF